MASRRWSPTRPSISWFGDAVTEADWDHLWLSEGFAEYFAAVFFEFRGGSSGRGPTQLARQMREKAAEVRELAAVSPGAIYAPGAGPGVRMEDRVAEVPVRSRGRVEVVLDPDSWLLFAAAPDPR